MVLDHILYISLGVHAYLSCQHHSSTDDKLAINKNSDRPKINDNNYGIPIIKVMILPHLSELLL